MPNPLIDMTDLVLRQAMTTGRVKNDSGGADQAGMEKACRDFESLFVNYLMKEMRETIPQNELFGGGSAEKIYTTMLDGEVAKHVSSAGGIGLADMLIEQMAQKNSIKK
jgi:flagellar protein FlgJ